MKYLIYLFLGLSLTAFGSDISKAPKSFDVGAKKYQFVDFESASYKITYDAKTQVASYHAHVKFELTTEGYPLFDVVTPAEKMTIGEDGTRYEEAVKASLLSLPSDTTKMYGLDKKLKPGVYHLKLTGKITELVRFNEEKVRSAFWMSDLSDRGFLEKYLPANLDYDQFQISLDVQVTNSDSDHLFMVNCEKKEFARNHWAASCPSYYTSSLLFYHLFEKGAYEVETFEMKSIDNRSIEFTVYSNETMSRYTELAKSVFNELERDYGPWLHDQMIIYGTGGMMGGGMEYAGATMTSIRALGHEMHHSYFARAMSPAGGNAGWIDEALASWRDSKYPRGGGLSRTRMGGRSQYERETDRAAYSKGMNFIAHLDERFAGKEGMLPFLKEFGQTHKFKTFTTPFFQEKLEEYFNDDLSALFDGYIYGKSGFKKDRRGGKLSIEENPYHPTLTKTQLESLL